jgi:hypothetical protein
MTVLRVLCQSIILSGKASKSAKYGRKRSTSKMEDRDFERTVQNNRFYNAEDIHKKWSRHEFVSAKVKTHRWIQEMG